MDKMTERPTESPLPKIRRRMVSNSPDGTETNPVVLHDSVLDVALNKFSNIRAVNLVKFFSVAVTMGSLMYEFYPPARGSYFSDKHNFLNQYFVKLAWGWTMAIHTSFIVFSSLQSPVDAGQVVRGLVRVLLVGTAVWYFWVEIVFHRVMQATGACVGNASLTEVRACIRDGHHWDGFDISGHCFLLIYSALLIHEELQIISNIKSKTPAYHSNSQSAQTMITIPVANVTIGYRSLVNFLQQLFTVLMTLFELLWILMVMMTSIYFHVWSHKLLGTLIAFASWHCTYNLWYQTTLSPGS
ncbi:fat storage-inducing transmembrane protein 2-like [Acanthaster planci]|uniref:Fat storage-inducing transmembrane protein 2-like n=1 Tax=Acanthaster planci TaxID=133434 RepID=A0A8B7YYG8_ACAPL|nr:fat storage-inducing transmembrane protein 2-like [Acanthaster planci]